MAKTAFKYNENEGSAFTNDQKTKDTQPDFTGRANIAGEMYRLAIWDNEYGDGGSRLAIKFETEEEFQSRINTNTDGGKKDGGTTAPPARASRRPAARR